MRRRRAAQWQAAGQLAAVVALLVVAALAPAARWYIVNFLLLLGLIAAMIVPHELGHALAARLVGMRVHSICIGSGPTLAEFTAGGVHVECKLVPLGGATMASHRTTYFARSRQWLMVAAGPAVNAALFALGLVWLPAADVLIAWADNQPAPLATFITANLFVCVFNLLPRKVSTAFGPVGSDGHALLTIPLATDADVQSWNSANYLIEAISLYRAHRYNEASRVLDEGLRMYPEDNTLMSTRGALLLLIGEADAAIDIYKQLLQRPGLDDGRRAIAINNLAAAHLQRDAPGDLARADERSAEAYQAMPWVTSFRATRGSVLVRQGAAAEGMNLLRGVLAEMEHHRDLAATLAYIALAHKQLARDDEADEAMAQAREVDAECPAIAVVQRHLDAAGTRPPTLPQGEDHVPTA